MAGIKDINKKITQPVDTYLKFVQQTFNTCDVSFLNILKQLDAFAKSRQTHYEEAANLRDRLNTIQILKDPSKYKKFDKLGNFNLSGSGLRETYRVANDIIKDIDVARDWLTSYKRFNMLTSTLRLDGLHSELIKLGQSILGRAIELTPMKTGTLRQSGVLLDFGTYIIIAFTAPYATYVHENMEITHPNHSSNPNCGGRAKFLEVALQEFFPDRTVWTEIHGYNGVMCKISINPLLLEYSHYS
jgi:hypothetical protein